MSDTDLSAGAKLVYAALSMFENPKTGQCNPSQEQLADAIGSGRATVQRGIKQLLALGYITADRNKNRAEYGLCNASKRVNALTQNDTPRPLPDTQLPCAPGNLVRTTKRE